MQHINKHMKTQQKQFLSQNQKWNKLNNLQFTIIYDAQWTKIKEKKIELQAYLPKQNEKKRFSCAPQCPKPISQKKMQQMP